ncbi:hypothetical protein FIU94_00125 [Sulfitobacter sp. THAF37]|uniref:DUF1194 domain-containing protein n=1 Tax=Sulfitobacter sp. THAF37 TaxID=2587855 RepID=UPI001268A5FC|nr:DUF1194 domain-containing protein [Sulfitobacter sp. THAF37]QFT57212.1 hypothetical protein FIU94_00125 [Sulfitobacter sp. THAF37]
MSRAAVLGLVLGLALAPGGATADCRQALALALDVSGSVDAREYRQQINGVAQALDSAEVRTRILSMPEAPIRLLVFEWSGPQDQTELVPWISLDSGAALDGVIARLRETERRVATPGTALGVAMTEGVRQLSAQTDCWKRTLDISGDGKSNLGPRPRSVKPTLQDSGVTINALVIGVDDPATGDIRQAEIGELSAYFRAEVIMGPGAFVRTATGYADYARAMKEKLLEEMEGLVVSDAAPLPAQ